MKRRPGVERRRRRLATRPYQNYAEFKAAMGEISPTKTLKSLKSSTSSLAKALGREGFPITQTGNIEQDQDFISGIRNEFFGLAKSLEGNIASKKSLSNDQIDRIIRFQEIMNGLAKQGYATGKFTAIKLRLDQIQEAMQVINEDNLKAAKGALGKMYRPLITGLGDMAEEMMREAFKSESLQKVLAEKGMEQAIGMSVGKGVSPSGLRAEISYTRELNKQKVVYTNKKGTPLTDIELKLGEDGGEFRISVKQNLQGDSVAKKTLKAYTTTYGNLMSQIEGGTEYFWWTFHRILGRLGGNSSASQECKNYILQKNLKEALLGSGIDEVGDFIINGKLYSADYFIDELVKELERKQKKDSQVLSLQSSLQVNPVTNNKDEAVRRFISSKNVNNMLATQAIIRVGIPTQLLKK